MNALDALRRMIANYPGGRPAVAARLGKPDEVLRKELGAGDTHKMGLVDAVTIAGMCAEVSSPDAAALAHCVAAESHGSFTPASHAKQTAENVVSGLARQTHEAAELVEAVLQSLADGAVSDNELKTIEREAGDLLLSIQSLVEACRRNNAASRPVNWPSMQEGR